MSSDVVPTRTRVAPRRRLVGAAAATASLVLLAGCAEAEQVARSAGDELARQAVAEATASEQGRQEAREQAQRALDSALDRLPGTCADVVTLPPSTRDDQALTVLRSFWLAELHAEEPPPETVEAFAEAVVERCRDSRETAAATVLREVWASGDFAP